MIVAARRPALTTLGDLCGLALLLQAAGRLLSVAIEGKPSVPFLGAMDGEAIAGALVLLGRDAEVGRGRADGPHPRPDRL